MKQQLTKTEAHVLECLCALIPSLIQSNDLLDLRKVSYLFADQLLIGVLLLGRNDDDGADRGGYCGADGEKSFLNSLGMGVEKRTVCSVTGCINSSV